jgi:GNAT superfamily N-acetyltransferase
METLQLIDPCEEKHFCDMSLLHALGWRTAYRDSIPDDYMAREITDGRWVPVFRENYEVGIYRGLLLYDGDTPLCCATYGPARVDQSAGDTICNFSSPDLAAWGELVSLYSHPDHWEQGHGSLVIEEVLNRVKATGCPGCFLYVLRENERARRFYEKHGFVWDGHALNVALTPDTTLSDLRYRKEFHV